MNLTNISKLISLVLRHKPEQLNLQLDSHGYAQVKDLVAAINKQYKDFTVADLEHIVATDDKQRYKFNNDHTKLRAVQGHSIKVDLELKPQQPPAVLYHGTAVKYISGINEQGLIPKSRQYVHLSTDYATAVKVGQRHGDAYVYGVDAQLMYEQGYNFYCAENGVWLTDFVPVRFLIN